MIYQDRLSIIHSIGDRVMSEFSKENDTLRGIVTILMRGKSESASSYELSEIKRLLFVNKCKIFKVCNRSGVELSVGDIINNKIITDFNFSSGCIFAIFDYGDSLLEDIDVICKNTDQTHWKCFRVKIDYTPTFEYQKLIGYNKNVMWVFLGLIIRYTTSKYMSKK